MHQRLYSRRIPHIARASYGVPFVRIWVKNDRVITAPHINLPLGCAQVLLYLH